MQDAWAVLVESGHLMGGSLSYKQCLALSHSSKTLYALYDENQKMGWLQNACCAQMRLLHMQILHRRYQALTKNVDMKLKAEIMLSDQEYFHLYGVWPAALNTKYVKQPHAQARKAWTDLLFFATRFPSYLVRSGDDFATAQDFLSIVEAAMDAGDYMALHEFAKTKPDLWCFVDNCRNTHLHLAAIFCKHNVPQVLHEVMHWCWAGDHCTANSISHDDILELCNLHNDKGRHCLHEAIRGHNHAFVQYFCSFWGPAMLKNIRIVDITRPNDPGVQESILHYTVNVIASYELHLPASENIQNILEVLIACGGKKLLFAVDYNYRNVSFTAARNRNKSLINFLVSKDRRIIARKRPLGTHAREYKIYAGYIKSLRKWPTIGPTTSEEENESPQSSQ